MGTRHLIEVVSNGVHKVAQYGQWDGYPSGQGVTVLDFLRNNNMADFKTAVDGCWFVTQSVIRQYYIDAGDNPDNTSGFISIDISSRFEREHPTLCRDVGARILKMILDSKTGVELIDSSSFANDTTFCEFVYSIDLDRNTLSCYECGKTNKFYECSIFDVPSDKDFLDTYEKWSKERE